MTVNKVVEALQKAIDAGDGDAPVYITVYDETVVAASITVNPYGSVFIEDTP